MQNLMAELELGSNQMAEPHLGFWFGHTLKRNPFMNFHGGQTLGDGVSLILIYGMIDY